MALWNDGRRRGRMNLDDMARSGDTSLNLIVVVLLVAALAVGWWSYGRVTPASDIAAPPSMTRVAPAPYPVSPTPPAPDATTAKPTPTAPSPSTTP